MDPNIKMFRQISNTLAELSQFCLKSKTAEPLSIIRDHFLTDVRKYLKSQCADIPHFLELYCVKCGSYENVAVPNSLCFRCSLENGSNPKGGNLTWFVYEETDTHEPGKQLGVIRGNTLTDLAFQFGKLAANNHYHHYIFTQGNLFGCTYANEDDKVLLIFDKKIKQK